MSMTRQTILASRPAAMVLALSLVAGLTAPFLMLPRAQAAATPPSPAPCTVVNNNGCTELSATPPEDTVAVPPNIVLMLDDSGSMAWGFMPDWDYLADTSKSAVIDAAVNGVYYDPTVVYTLPPQADGTPYPDFTDITRVSYDGFLQPSNHSDLTTYTASNTESNGENNLQYSYSANVKITIVTYSDITSSSKCKKKYNDYNGTPSADGRTYDSNADTCTLYYNKTVGAFQFSTGPAGGAYTKYYVAATADDCTNLGLSNCVAQTDTSGVYAPAGIQAGTNIAHWFAYYHTRMLMAKSGLMAAFDKLNPNYRFGFGSINANALRQDSSLVPSPTYTFNNKCTTGNCGSTTGYATNKLAAVQQFGAAMIPDPSDPTGSTLIKNSDSQRYNFWKWIVAETPSGGTPLRKSLEGVGKYYQTSQPWSTMQGDPGYSKTGSNPTYACRASYAILTTDGFWNGDPPGVGNADNTSSGPYAVPSGDNVAGYAPAAPFKDSTSNTLADVAMYYWQTDLSSMINEVATGKQDPAAWQHMSTFTMGLGFTPQKSASDTTPMPVQQIFAWAQGGTAISGFQWPTPSGSGGNGGSINNIADLLHAAVNGHGDFFSAKSPQDLAAGFSKAIAEISQRTTTTSAASVNASVVAVGAVGFGTSYNTGDWSGDFNAYALLPPNATPSKKPIWYPSPADLLDTAYHTTAAAPDRPVYTDAYNPADDTPFSSFQFSAANVDKLDPVEVAGLGGDPAASVDTPANRINYLLGSSKYEGAPNYRTRATLLGAIIHAQPVYVGYPTGNYFSFPTGTPEALAAAAAASDGSDDKSYDSFVARHASRAPTVYQGANDGMLHAFNAPVPQCTTYDPDTGACDHPGTDPGKEDWAFIPRAVYANLGNLTNADFQFRPTVDATPVTRDVFFSENGSNEWHTLLAGGVGLGGRGVYALDISGEANSSSPAAQPTVQWEFDADMPTTGCKSNIGSCVGTDLGFTVSQPNIGRLANGRWVVIVPNGYFPDCSASDIPTDPNAASTDPDKCQNIANQAPGWADGTPYSALFVLDAQTGAVIAELKTPQISGVTSYGLATPVLGDYQNDQIDDVAFAGDAQGNLWRFDLCGAAAPGDACGGPSSWTVTLAYKGGTAKDPNGNTVMQPITSMPRLFPDPTTNRFMVVFGTGRFLGVGDNSNKDVQAVYGVRDQGSTADSSTAYTQADLVPQYLHETTIPADAKLPDGSPDPNAGASLRCVTGNASDTCDSSMSGGAPSPINPVPASKGGWYINLQTKTTDGTVNDAGERVVVNPGAIFASNTVVFETLITGSQSSDPCSPTTVGSIMALNALTGGASGISSLGGGNIVGGRINNARTSGSLPLMSALGGGQAYLPGTTLAPNGTSPLSIDAPIWRRRSWSEINQNP
jgi:type IV pilus assembly protein PilY1